MALYAIGDLHLSFGEGVSKPMDKFGGQWVGHTEKLHRNWTENIGTVDVVILCGDHSWGLRLDEAMADLDWIHNLPGRKILFKGDAVDGPVALAFNEIDAGGRGLATAGSGGNCFLRSHFQNPPYLISCVQASGF